MTMTTTAIQTAMTAIVLSATLPETNSHRLIVFNLSLLQDIIIICCLINSISSQQTRR